MEKLKHNKLNVFTGSKGHFYLSTKEEPAGADFDYGHINTNTTINSNYEAEYKGLDIMPTDDYYEFVETNRADDGFVTEYAIHKWGARIRENVKLVPDMNVLVQTTTYENTSDTAFELTGISSTQVLGIGIGGSKYFEKDRFVVHYCSSKWCCEGQWQTKSIADLGIIPGSERIWEICKFRIGDEGSFPTASYYPLLIIEDKEEGNAWFFESETSGSWFIEIQACSGWLCPFLCVEVGGADEKSGLRHTLNPGESFTTQPAFYGVVKGDFNDAVNEILKYKRLTSTKNFDTVPVCFNDFMNCNWAVPTWDRIIPLVDKCAEVGCEYFVIDAGWSELGEWVPYETDIWGDYGFEGIIKYISDKGMKPGIWFEFETTSFEVAKKLGFGEDYIRTREGKVVADHRPKVNIRMEEVRKYLKERIKHVYDLGVRFIKNDHNNGENFGTTDNGDCPYMGVLNNGLATETFYDEIHNEFPDLIIENCAGGSGRSTHGLLKRAYLQSFSDQENYKLVPSIMIGQSACIAPEKIGVWTYPYPLLSTLKLEGPESKKALPQSEIDKMVDGEQTAFNMISSMMGLVYLSGKIQHADEKNTRLIKDSITTYKSYVNWLQSANPVFVEKMKNVTDKTYNAYGLEKADKTEMILAVWCLEQKEFSVNLEKYGYKSAEMIYPVELDGVEYGYNGKKMNFKFTKNNSARLFKLTK